MIELRAAFSPPPPSTFKVKPCHTSPSLTDYLASVYISESHATCQVALSPSSAHACLSGPLQDCLTPLLCCVTTHRRHRWQVPSGNGHPSPEP